jgi:transcription elongation factor Elf1
MNIRINSGKAVHKAEVKTDKNGKEFTVVSCGAIKHHLAGKTVVRPAGNEEVTCKKCLAQMETEKPAEEMSIKEYVEKFGRSFTMTKEEMGR